MASDLVIVLLCGTLGLFILVFFGVNEWILARPFRHLLDAIDATENTRGLLMIDLPARHDEWGVLAERLFEPRSFDPTNSIKGERETVG